MLRPLFAKPRKRRRLRGGWRQRAAVDDDEASDDRLDSFLSRLAGGQLLDWCDGVTSASQVQAHMQNAVLDDRAMGREPHCMVQKLADIGESQHAHAGLLSLLEDLGLAALLTVQPLSETTAVNTMLLPSTVIRVVHQHYRYDFPKLFGADTFKLREFWGQFMSRPVSYAWAQRHPHLRGKSVGSLVCTIPCALHCDTGPATKNASVYCLSWSSILGGGGEKISKYLAASYVKMPDQTNHDAWRRLLADFDELASGAVSGSFVAQDQRRTWKFVLLLSKADEDCDADDLL